MSRVLVISVAALAAVACSTGMPGPSGFVDTVAGLAASGHLAPEVAQEVIDAYRAQSQAPAWWESTLQTIVDAGVSVAIAVVLSMLGVRYLPPQLLGRGAPEAVRQSQRGRMSDGAT